MDIASKTIKYQTEKKRNLRLLLLLLLVFFFFIIVVVDVGAYIMCEYAFYMRRTIVITITVAPNIF